MDGLRCFRAHAVETVKTLLRNLNVKLNIIPPKFTPTLQPLDVSGGVNGVFKAEMRSQWQKWMLEGEKEYTPKGYRKRPSWEKVLEFTSDSLKKVAENIDVVKKSFVLCGIAPLGTFVQFNSLNARLRGILDNDQGMHLADDEANVLDDNDDDPFELETDTEDEEEVLDGE